MELIPVRDIVCTYCKLGELRFSIQNNDSRDKIFTPLSSNIINLMSTSSIFLEIHVVYSVQTEVSSSIIGDPMID